MLDKFNHQERFPFGRQMLSNLPCVRLSHNIFPESLFPILSLISMIFHPKPEFLSSKYTKKWVQMTFPPTDKIQGKPMVCAHRNFSILESNTNSNSLISLVQPIRTCDAFKFRKNQGN